MAYPEVEEEPTLTPVPTVMVASSGSIWFHQAATARAFMSKFVVFDEMTCEKKNADAFAEQLADVHSYVQLHDQVHPVQSPLTARAVGVHWEQRFVVGAVAKVPPFELPQTPFTVTPHSLPFHPYPLEHAYLQVVVLAVVEYAVTESAGNHAERLPLQVCE